MPGMTRAQLRANSGSVRVMMLVCLKMFERFPRRTRLLFRIERIIDAVNSTSPDGRSQSGDVGAYMGRRSQGHSEVSTFVGTAVEVGGEGPVNRDQRAKLEARAGEWDPRKTSCVSLASANAQDRVHGVVRRPDPSADSTIGTARTGHWRVSLVGLRESLRAIRREPVVAFRRIPTAHARVATP